MLILVTGWRLHSDEHAVYDALDALWRPVQYPETVTLIHGARKTGADDYAATWAISRGVPQLPFPAENFGVWPWCGPRRNKAMVRHLMQAADANRHVVAFPQPDWETAKVCGTRGCIKEARKAGFVPQIHVAPAVTP